MATDLPDDSGEFESFRGYVVSDAPAHAAGGPVPGPPAPDKRPLDYPPGRFESIPQALEQRLWRTRPARNWINAPLVPNAILAAWLIVPGLCGALVWVIGMMGR